MRASHSLSGVSVSCDEPNLVSGAGLLPAAGLTQKIGLAGLVEQRVRLARHGANGGTKALTVIGSMLLGGIRSPTPRCCRRARPARCSISFAHRRRSDRGCARSSGPTCASRRRDSRAAGPVVGRRRRPGRSCGSVDVRSGLHDLPGLRPGQAGRRVRLRPASPHLLGRRPPALPPRRLCRCDRTRLSPHEPSPGFAGHHRRSAQHVAEEAEEAALVLAVRASS